MDSATYLLMSSSRVRGFFPPERGRLRVDGTTFRTESGELFGWRGKSMFLLFLRYCRGEDITLDLRWFRAHAINMLRIFGPLPWPETPDYRVEKFRFDKLPGFFGLLEKYGLRCNWSLAHYRHPDLPEHVQRWYDIADQFWAPVAEAVNEPHVGVEKPDPIELLRDIDTRGVPTAYGYYKQYYDKLPGLDPAKHFGTIHTTRDSSWARKARHAQELQDMLGNSQPWVNDEPAKAIEIGSLADHPPTTAIYPGFNYVGGKTNPDEFAWYHAVSALWTPGSTVHDEHGKWGHIPPVGSQQHRCVQAVVEHVFKRIGPEWQTGEYNRGGNGDSPVDNAYIEGVNEVWTYTSLHARAGKALSVRCGFPSPKPINGWRIADAWGPFKTILRLER